MGRKYTRLASKPRRSKKANLSTSEKIALGTVKVGFDLFGALIKGLFKASKR